VQNYNFIHEPAVACMLCTMCT